jgi:hypothetical protein
MLGDDIDVAGYSPLDWRPADLSWGFTAREARSQEPLSARLAQEIPDETEEILGDGIGDTTDTYGAVVDDQFGSVRAGRLTWAVPESFDPAGGLLGERHRHLTVAVHQRRKPQSTSSWIRTICADREHPSTPRGRSQGLQ